MKMKVSIFSTVLTAALWLLMGVITTTVAFDEITSKDLLDETGRGEEGKRMLEGHAVEGIMNESGKANDHMTTKMKQVQDVVEHGGGSITTGGVDSSKQSEEDHGNPFRRLLRGLLNSRMLKSYPPPPNYYPGPVVWMYQGCYHDCDRDTYDRRKPRSKVRKLMFD
jgi:hypothetical protein